MTSLAAAEIEALAKAAGHPLPAERVQPAGEALGEVIALAETLDRLSLEGVEPVLGQPSEPVGASSDA